MVLFVFVFGGAIDTGSLSYIDYMLPGILLITIASGIAYTAYRLFGDLQGGIFERFQSMPIARASALWAHVLTSLVANLASLVIVVGVALLMGFRTGTSVLGWLAVAGILILFTLALTWIAVIAGLSAKTVDGASAFSYPLIFLPFISSAFVPTDTMPAPVAWFAENQPVTPDRQHDPRHLLAAAGRQRHLDRPGLVRRHPHRRVLRRDGDLPTQDQLRQVGHVTDIRPRRSAPFSGADLRHPSVTARSSSGSCSSAVLGTLRSTPNSRTEPPEGRPGERDGEETLRV